jgi:rubredoxin
MKIIKRCKIPNVTCKVCGTVFKPSKRNLINIVHYDRFDHARCPICKTSNRVFKEVD